MNIQRSGFLLFSLFFFCLAQASGQDTVAGKVFNDLNRNGRLDNNEVGIEGVCVSNGKDVVRSGKNGDWKLPVDSGMRDLFVIKPSGYQVPVADNMVPQHAFSWTNKSDLEQQVLFPLFEVPERDSFSVVFFGDPQARGTKEMNYVFHDVVEELIGTDAWFGVSLGDMVADDPEMLDDISEGIAQIGIPWYNIFGNHDNDRDALSNDDRDKTFRKFFGPGTFAFEYGNVAFIGLNNIFFQPDGKYRPSFTQKQLSFVENYTAQLPADQLTVLMMHAPIVECDNREAMFRILETRKYTFSISGHVHEQFNLLLGEKEGWKGKEAHHHLVNATVCGSWWCGLNDELGIPHATMNDGAPNGYSIISFDGNQYKVRFKAARRPPGYQMNIYFPEEIKIADIADSTVLVNVFAGSVRSVVEMKVGNEGKWFQLQKKDQIDPQSLRVHQLNRFLEKEVDGVPLEDVLGYEMDYPSVSTHMWEGALPGGLAAGTYTLWVRTTDMFGQSWSAHRIFRVTN
ncbi:calcineurin-like phosphoesterase C-terminal domain-containing protein [Maribellus sp. YY47]|uniref:calcineurin-like phosphoesterase C-terminal domain-containing protein n=1 Tax=Maribellus sp. YY47 TaxID=2929486 RepID=UPI00200187CC|nr:calcineurin-like phosphoesterase C-terminal domain-containing protein [Maribellus sp. YY47]MCK3682824.1 calcineurin-like phosphoesterase C-terminal domain-containing protein [Maribellus sp. YY47]